MYIYPEIYQGRELGSVAVDPRSVFVNLITLFLNIILFQITI